MFTFFLATSNKHKLQEFSSILSPNLVYPVEYSTVVEKYSTYSGNSLLKLNALLAFSEMNDIDKDNRVFLADDSGLEIESMDNQPGVYSARFLAGLSQKEKNIYIVEKLSKFENKKAKFICCLSYSFKGKTYQVSAMCHGRIIQDVNKIIATEKDFGYDPIFIPDGYDQPFNVLPESVKLTKSHRALASLLMLNNLESIKTEF